MASARMTAATLLALATGLAAQHDAPALADRFVAIALDENQKGAREASIWDVPLQRPATRRLVLGESPWSPTPLLDSAGLLRWQVRPEGGARRHYDVRILRFDAKTFTVDDLLRTSRATALGGAGEHVIVRTAEGPVALEPKTGRVRKLARPIEVLARHGDQWLVTVDGHLARFDAAKAEIVREYDKVPARRRFDRNGTTWSGGRYVVRNGAFFDEGGEQVVALDFGTFGIVYQDVHICDLDTGAESTVRVRMQALGGSGVGVIPTAMPTELVGGMFRYVERRPATGAHADFSDFVLTRDAQWVTVDVATGKELLRADYEPRDLGRPDPMEAIGAPAYLHETFAAERLPPTEENLVRTFLADRNVRITSLKSWCRTGDGDHVLALADGKLYLCALAARTVKSWQAPKVWSRQIQLELHAIETSGS